MQAYTLHHTLLLHVGTLPGPGSRCRRRERTVGDLGERCPPASFRTCISALHTSVATIIATSKLPINSLHIMSTALLSDVRYQPPCRKSWKLRSVSFFQLFQQGENFTHPTKF